MSIQDVKAGSAYVDLYTKDQRLNAGLAGIKSKLRSFTGGLSAIVGMSSPLGMLLGGTTVAASFLSIRAVSEALDEVGKASDRLGVAVEDLQALRYAADLAGSSGEELTKGLDRLNAGLGEAASGSGPAKDALVALGLSAKELIAVGPAQAFYTIADALDKIPNAAQRAAIIKDIFGKGGVGLTGVLLEGGAKLREYRAELERMGGVFSREQIGRLEEANDAMSRMATAVKSLAGELAINLAPAITKVANAFAFGLNKGVEFIKIAGLEARLLIAQQSGDTVMVREIEKLMDAIVRGGGEEEYMFPGKRAADAKARTGMAEVADDGKAAVKVGETLDDILKDIQTKLSGVRGEDPVLARIEAWRAASDAAGNSILWTDEQVEKLKMHLSELREAEEAAKATEAATSLKESLRTTSEQYRAKIYDLMRLRNANAIDDKTLARGMDKARDEMRRELLGESPVDQLQDTLKRLKEARELKEITPDEYNRRVDRARWDAVRAAWAQDGMSASSTGTFTGRALSGLGAGSRWGEITAKNTDKMVEKIDDLIAVAKDSKRFSE